MNLGGGVTVQGAAGRWIFLNVNWMPASFGGVRFRQNRRVAGEPLHTNFKLSRLVLVGLSTRAPAKNGRQDFRLPGAAGQISYGLSATDEPVFHRPTPGEENGAGSFKNILRRPSSASAAFSPNRLSWS